MFRMQKLSEFYSLTAVLQRIYFAQTNYSKLFAPEKLLLRIIVLLIKIKRKFLKAILETSLQPTTSRTNTLHFGQSFTTIKPRNFGPYI